MMQDRYISFDWAMKRMLRDKANFAVLEGLLTVLLNQKITIIEILESESNQQFPEDKFNRVDIKVHDEKGQIIIVEIQNTHELYFMERILYGVSKAVTEHMYLGKGYENVKKVISISILYFDLGKGSDYLYHGVTKFVGVHTHDELQVNAKERNVVDRKLPQEMFPEYYLIRVNEFDSVAKTPLEQWIRYLKTGEIHREDNAPGLSEARERLRYYNMSPEERVAYERHADALAIQYDVIGTAKLEGLVEGRMEGLVEGRAEGRVEGRAEGLVEGKKSVALSMKAEGLPSVVIAKCTGLSEEEIEAL